MKREANCCLNNLIMKKNAIGILLGLLFIHMGKISAQYEDELKHEVYAGYGVASLPRLVESAGNATIDLLEIFIGDQDFHKVSGSGAISIGYNYYPRKRWSIGLQGVFERINIEENNSPTERWDLFTLMARSGYRWVDKDRFKLYSSLAIGGFSSKYYTLNSFRDKEKEFNVGFSIIPIGVRFGSTVGFFLEPGIGFDGLIKAGVSGQF